MDIYELVNIKSVSVCMCKCIYVYVYVCVYRGSENDSQLNGTTLHKYYPSQCKDLNINISFCLVVDRSTHSTGGCILLCMNNAQINWTWLNITYSRVFDFIDS